MNQESINIFNGIDFSQEYKILARSYFPDCYIKDYKYSPYDFGFYIITFDFSIKVCLGTNCIHVYIHNQILLGKREVLMLSELEDTLKSLNRTKGNQSRSYTICDLWIGAYIAYRHSLIVLDSDPDDKLAKKRLKQFKDVARGIVEMKTQWKSFNNEARKCQI